MREHGSKIFLAACVRFNPDQDIFRIHDVFDSMDGFDHKHDDSSKAGKLATVAAMFVRPPVRLRIQRSLLCDGPVIDTRYANPYKHAQHIHL
jgi:hypothetical protein